MGWLIGYYDMDIYGEASASPYGHITVNFLTGEVTGGPASKSLSDAIERYREVLPGFCEKHGVSLAAFRELVVRFSGGPLGRRFEIAIQDQFGRRSTTSYRGVPAQRVKVLDGLGRVRPRVG